MKKFLNVIVGTLLAIWPDFTHAGGTDEDDSDGTEPVITARSGAYRAAATVGPLQNSNSRVEDQAGETLELGWNELSGKNPIPSEVTSVTLNVQGFGTFHILEDIMLRLERFFSLCSGLKKLESVRLNKSLEVICFANDTLLTSDLTHEFINRLTRLPQLKHLDFSMAFLNRHSVKKLASILPLMSTLESMDLSYNHVGHDGVNHLTAALHKSTSIRQLNLEATYIEDMGFITLMSFPGRLEYINLTSNLITMEGYQIESASEPQREVQETESDYKILIHALAIGINEGFESAVKKGRNPSKTLTINLGRVDKLSPMFKAEFGRYYGSPEFPYLSKIRIISGAFTFKVPSTPPKVSELKSKL